MTRLRRLWSDRSVKTQLLIVIAAINLLAVLLAAGISVLNSRVATRLEIEASLEIAQRFVEATIKDLAAEGQLNQLNERLSLQLRHLRHVRIMMMDTFGNLTELSPQPNPAGSEQTTQWVPRWFVALVAPRLADRSLRVVSVPHVRPIILTGEPTDEIAETWQGFSRQAVVWLGLNGLVLAVLLVVLDRILKPLGSLSRGMQSLEDGDYATRLKQPNVRELAVITNRFNTLATALDTARRENRRLYQRLISVQEQERREIANDLHDEAGPCLFGISANASSVKTIAEQMKHQRSGEISKRISEIISITERLKRMNRALLNRLKPEPLGRITLSELIDELVCDFQRRHPDAQIILAIGKLAKTYGEEIDLALYRCIQEGTTNALCHGKADNLAIDLNEQRASAANGAEQSQSIVRLVLRDNGTGFAPSTQKGFGLNAMTERVRSLNGSCLVESAPSEGTTISVEIPVQTNSARCTRRSELVGDLA
jgi:two-component system sensor histidine kinase UhpB